MDRLEASLGCMELAVRDGDIIEVKQQISMAVVHSNSVDSNQSAEEEAEFWPRSSSISPAPDSTNSWANSFNIFSGLKLPADHRLFEESDETSDNSEPSERTREDEQCFKRIMWALKQLGCEFQTACYHDDDDDDIDRCHLSEKWFQKDARHYDEQQKKKMGSNEAGERAAQLRRLDELEDLHQLQQLAISCKR